MLQLHKNPHASYRMEIATFSLWKTTGLPRLLQCLLALMPGLLKLQMRQQETQYLMRKETMAVRETVSCFWFLLYSPLSATATLGTEESDRYGKTSVAFLGEQRCFQKMPVLACVNQNANTTESTDARYRMIQYKGHTHEYKLFFLAKIKNLIKNLGGVQVWWPFRMKKEFCMHHSSVADQQAVVER